MKRMYVTLFLIFIAVLSAGTILAQQVLQSNDHSDDNLRARLRQENRLRMRGEMHRRMMEKLLHGSGPDQDMFQDMEQFMDEAMSDAFSIHSNVIRQNYKTEWKETSAGRTLEIIPASPSQQLDIKVSDGFVVINTKETSGNSVSSSSSSFNVPQDCDPAKVKMETKDGKIVMQFPYLVAKRLDNRKPVAPSKQDVPI